MGPLLQKISDAILTESRQGRPQPQRIELCSEDFLKFQQEHRAALAEIFPEIENIYPGSFAGVPVVDAGDGLQNAVLIRFDGKRILLRITC